ncbi:MAG TPA: DUF3365 domain-containing protein [Acetobacteraceae bacterium]|nr:DUF3365 domain-containing protein [Acetobacteraceae bacterium]
MKLKPKFNLVMIAVLAVSLSIASVFVDTLSRRMARESVLSEAAVMMAALNATVHYTDDEVAPLLARSMKVQFLPQSIPFFVAQRSFDLLSKERPDYTLRQPADNPTNPDDRPAAWETEIIRTFQARPELQSLTTERTTQAGAVLSYSQPVKVSDSCLECHSTPQRAPPSMIDLYGSQNGFNWKLGSTIGAEIVSVPQRVALERARRSLYEIMGALTVVFLFLLLTLNLLLDRVIIGPVRRISSAADEISLGNMEVPEFESRSRDEIGVLAMSFNRMRRSLAAAFRLLEGAE